MKKLIIIPGFGESTRQKEYQEIIKALDTRYNVVSYNPHWNYRTTTHWVKDFESSHSNEENATVLAFSIGSYIALILSAKFKFERLVLCSISPFFKEQIQHLTRQARIILGKRRITDLYHYNLPSEISGFPVFIFGDKDWDYAIEQASLLAKKYKGVYKIIKNTGHELNNEYIKEIVEILKGPSL